MRGQIDLPVYGDYVGRVIRELRCMAKSQTMCLRFSGGKDSVVLKWLFDQAGIPYQARFSRTSVDPPELLRFISKYHSDVIEEQPRISMFHLIIKKGFPPTRVCRYCCSEYKERNTCPKEKSVLTLTGVRKAESPKRRNRSRVETCLAFKGVTFFHPILDWTDEQLWNVIDDNHIPYCELYDEGFSRIGCVGCPLTSSKNIIREFRRWPNFEKAYLWAFERMLEGRQFDKWKTKYDVMDWYVYGVQEQYKKLDEENDKLWKQNAFRAYEDELYYGDYFDNLTHEYENRDVNAAIQILHSCQEKKEVSRIAC